MARKTKSSNTVRKLEDSSWLAQIIQDKMDVESSKMGLWVSSRWKSLNTLHIIVNKADDKDYDNIYLRNTIFNHRIWLRLRYRRNASKTKRISGTIQR